MRKWIYIFLNISVCIHANTIELGLPLPSQCRKEITSFVKSLSQVQHWRRQSYAGVGSAAIYRTPSQDVSRWLEARVFNNKIVHILELLPEKTTKYSWDSNHCGIQKQETTRKYNAARLEKEFSDKALINKIDSKVSGVIYAWSPHMPLSMAGIKPLKEATEQLGIELILVLDPHADKKISNEMAVKFSLNDAALKKLESVDLMLRGLGFHYPALVVFKNGKMNDFAIPGVKTSSEYQKLIARQLSSLKEAK